MENKSSKLSYVEYDFYETPQPTAHESTLRHGAEDGEYLYEKPNPSRLEQMVASNLDVVYYDVGPDPFEPEAEYIVEYPSNTKQNLPNNSTEMTKESRSGKKVIQDVYDEDGYCLARSNSHEVAEINVQRNTTKQRNSEETEGTRQKKIVLIVIGIFCCCIIGAVTAGIVVFVLGNKLCTERLRTRIC